MTPVSDFHRGSCVRPLRAKKQASVRTHTHAGRHTDTEREEIRRRSSLQSARGVSSFLALSPVLPCLAYRRASSLSKTDGAALVSALPPPPPPPPRGCPLNDGAARSRCRRRSLPLFIRAPAFNHSPVPRLAAPSIGRRSKTRR